MAAYTISSTTHYRDEAALTILAHITETSHGHTSKLSDITLRLSVLEDGIITRNDITAGTGVILTEDAAANTLEISIGQDVAPTSNVTFNQITTTSDVIINGDLTVNGGSTYIYSTTKVIADPLIELANGNNGNSYDIGFYGTYISGNTTLYTGLVWDASVSSYKLFKNLTTAPTDNEFTFTNHSLATLEAQITDITNHTINSLNDVDTTTNSPNAGQVLAWNGTNWAPTDDNNDTYTGGNGITINNNDISIEFTEFTTDDITEGTTKLFHTSERVDDRVNDLLQAGTNITLTYVDANGTLTIDATDTNTEYTAGTGVNIDQNNVISIGQDVATTSDVVFNTVESPIIFSAVASVNISKGQVVYISGTAGNGSTPTVALAQANSSNTMPAFGIAAQQATNGNSIKIVTFGTLEGITLPSGITFTLGDTLYVSSTTAGEYTNAPPTGESNLIQNIGKLQRAHPSSSVIKVGGAGRTNATPNLNSGNIFYGSTLNRTASTTLTAGNNVTITLDETVTPSTLTIDATDTNTEYTAGTGVNIDQNNVISIGQDVATTSDVVFGSLRINNSITNPYTYGETYSPGDLIIGGDNNPPLLTFHNPSTNVSADDECGIIQFCSKDDANVGYCIAKIKVAHQVGPGSGNSGGGYITFHTSPGGTGVSSVENVRIDHLGNLGINTDNPQSLLHLKGDSQSWTTSPTIIFESTNTNSNVRNWRIGPADTNFGNFHIAKSGTQGTYPDSDAEAQIFTIDYQGKVGINTITPNVQLDIVGGVTTGGQIRLSSVESATSALKDTRIVSRHYDPSEEDIMLIGCRSGGSSNIIRIGGGRTECNTATQVLIYTADTTNEINNDPFVNITNTRFGIDTGSSGPQRKFHLVNRDGDPTTCFAMENIRSNSNTNQNTTVISFREEVFTAGVGTTFHESGAIQFKMENSNTDTNNGLHSSLSLYTYNEGVFDGYCSLNGRNLGLGTETPKSRLHINLDMDGDHLSYLNGSSATFDADVNITVVHNSSAIGTGTAAGLKLTNNDNTSGAPSPLIAFGAKSASGTYNHTYACIYGIKTAGGADANWTRGDIVLATGKGTGPIERIRVLSDGSIAAGISSSNGRRFRVYGSGDIAQFTCTNNTAGGAQLDLTHERADASPADGDNVGIINFGGLDSGGSNPTLYGTIATIVDDVASKQGHIIFKTRDGSIYDERIRVTHSGTLIIRNNANGLDSPTTGYLKESFIGNHDGTLKMAVNGASNGVYGTHQIQARKGDSSDPRTIIDINSTQKTTFDSHGSSDIVTFKNNNDATGFTIGYTSNLLSFDIPSTSRFRCRHLTSPSTERFSIEADGDVVVGGGGLGRLQVRHATQHYSGTTDPTYIAHFYRFKTLQNIGVSFIHLKTDIIHASTTGSTSQMYSFEFKGYEYGASKPVNAHLVFYNYPNQQSTINVGTHGTHTCDVYESSDNKVVLRIAVTDGYYTAFTVSQHTTAQQIVEVQITSSAHSTSGAYF